VDDNQELVELVSDMLRFYGYRVECSYDGQDALNLIKKEPGKFDLLITDMEMPRLDGYRLVVKARAAGSREESSCLRERCRSRSASISAISLSKQLSTSRGASPADQRRRAAPDGAVGTREFRRRVVSTPNPAGAASDC
jgi:CheY-like chemotaxis protein